MYYYDSKPRSCKTFIYGGCMGNGNRYATEEECLKSCRDVVVFEAGRDPVWEQIPDSGNCHAYMPRYYDKFDGECKRFMYSGCGGNGNNFITLEDCESRCRDGKQTKELKKYRCAKQSEEFHEKRTTEISNESLLLVTFR